VADVAVVAHSRKSLGAARPASKKLRIKVRPASVTVCVPPARRG
jgi:hypothetical protein